MHRYADRHRDGRRCRIPSNISSVVERRRLLEWRRFADLRTVDRGRVHVQPVESGSRLYSADDAVNCVVSVSVRTRFPVDFRHDENVFRGQFWDSGCHDNRCTDLLHLFLCAGC